MKHYLYNAILFVEGDEEHKLTHMDRIVYSYLVYQSFWYEDNCQNVVHARQELVEGENDAIGIAADIDYELDYSGIKLWKVANDLRISIRMVYKSIERLGYAGYISAARKAVYISRKTLSEYFELLPQTGLNGKSLIVFSYIYHIRKSFDGGRMRCVTIADKLNMTPKNISDTLKVLEESGHITKTRHWKSTTFDLHIKPRPKKDAERTIKRWWE